MDTSGSELAAVSVGIKVDLDMFQRGLDSVRQQLTVFDQQASSGGLAKTGTTTKALGADAVTTAANLRNMAAATSTSTKGLLEHEAAVGLNRLQMMELGHSARSTFDILASGGTPLRALELEGTRLVQVLSLGEGGLVGAFAAMAPVLLPVAGIAAAVGLGFAGLTSELDRSTGKSITFMETIKATGQALWQDFTGLIKPAVGNVGNWFGQLVDFITPTVKALGNSIVGNFRLAYDNTLTYWQMLPAALGDVTIGAANFVMKSLQGMINGSIDLLNSFITTAKSTLGPLGSALGTIGHVDFGKGLDNPFAGANDRLTKQLQQNTATDLSTDYMGAFFSQVQTFALKDYAADQLGKLSKAAKEAAKQFSDLLTTGKDDTASLQAQAASLGRTTEQTAYLEEQTKLLNKARQDGLKLSPQQLNQLDGEAKAYAKAKTELDELTQVYDIGKSSFEGFFSTLKTGFQNGESAVQAFGDATGKVFDDLANKALQMAADGIWNSIFGALGGGTGGGLLGSLLGLGSPVSAGVGIAGGALPRFASGTTAAPGGLSLVGERGPELINLPRGAQVISAPQTAAMMSAAGGASGPAGGWVVNVNIDAKGAEIGVEAKIARAMSSMLRNQLPSAMQRVQANTYRRGYMPGGTPA